MKILFADDNADTRMIYQLGFDMAGHQVELACDGAEAIRATEQHDFDVVVMDLEMPVIGGWDAIRAIRKTEKGRTLPVVVLSAYFTVEYEEQVKTENVDMVLSKPILPEQLTLLLEKLVARKAKAR